MNGNNSAGPTSDNGEASAIYDISKAFRHLRQIFEDHGLEAPSGLLFDKREYARDLRQLVENFAPVDIDVRSVGPIEDDTLFGFKLRWSNSNQS